MSIKQTVCDTTFLGKTFSTTMTCVLFPAQIIETLNSFKNMLLVSDRPLKRNKSYKDFNYGQKEMMQFLTVTLQEKLSVTSSQI